MTGQTPDDVRFRPGFCRRCDLRMSETQDRPGGRRAFTCFRCDPRKPEPARDPARETE